MNTNKPILLALGFVVATGVIGSVLSPENTIQILGFCGIVTVSLVGLVKQYEMSAKQEDADEKRQVIAKKVEEVKLDLDKRSTDQDKKLSYITAVAEKNAETGEKVHTLVNSQTEVHLRVNVGLAHRVRELITKPEDIASADRAVELAEKMLADHMEKQGVVDEKERKENA